MGRPCAFGIAALVAVSALAGAAAASTAPQPTTASVLSRFATVAGQKLLVDRRATYPGHYTAYTLLPSISNRARFGPFTVWIVTSGAEEDVVNLLEDPHTGLLGTPGLSQIYWEPGKDLHGTPYWLAKRRYGANVVLWWYGDAQKIDARFKRLHRALLPPPSG